MSTYRSEIGDSGFSKTIIPLKLMEYEGKNLSPDPKQSGCSGEQTDLKVFLNFNGITEIGQAFADEFSGSIGRSNPQVHLYPVNASDDVWTMINRALGSDVLSEGSLFKDEDKALAGNI